MFILGMNDTQKLLSTLVALETQNFPAVRELLTIFIQVLHVAVRFLLL